MRLIDSRKQCQFSHSTAEQSRAEEPEPEPRGLSLALHQTDGHEVAVWERQRLGIMRASLVSYPLYKHPRMVGSVSTALVPDTNSTW